MSGRTLGVCYWPILSIQIPLFNLTQPGGFMDRSVFLIVLWTILVVPVFNPVVGQWGARCAPVGAAVFGDVPSVSPVGLQYPNDACGSGWYRFTDAPEYWGYWRLNHLVGRFHQRTKVWQSWDGANWGLESFPPWERNFGVEQNKIGQRERFMIGDREVHQDQWESSFAASDGIPNDAKAPYVTVFDPNEQRRAATVANIRYRIGQENVRLQDYNPTNPRIQWAIEGFKLNQDRRYARSGVVTVVQGQRDPQDGFAPAMAATYETDPQRNAEATVRACPSYDPNKVSDNLLDRIKNYVGDNVILLGIICLLAAACLIGYAAKKGNPAAQRVQASAVDLLDSALNELQAGRAHREQLVKQGEDEMAKVAALLQKHLESLKPKS